MRKWALLFLLANLIGLLNFGVALTAQRAEGSTQPARVPLLMELTGAWAFFVLLPAVLAFMQRVPIRREDWWRRVPLHVLATAVFGATHTLLMWGSRTLAYALLDWGTYDYGDMRYRFVMEYLKQGAAYWLIYAAVATFDYVERARRREVQAAELQRQLTEARLAALKMQLNPHFLFNTLNMISSHVHDDPDRADAMIAQLSDFLRLALRHAEVQEVPVRTELEFLAAYLAIMQARFEERLEVQVDAAPEAREALVPHLVLQPLVENAVTHATSDHGGPGRVRIEVARDGARLRLLVQDNGPGLGGEPVGKGIGLTNTAERLQALYGDEQRLGFEAAPGGGLRVVIEVPFRTVA